MTSALRPREPSVERRPRPPQPPRPPASVPRTLRQRGHLQPQVALNRTLLLLLRERRASGVGLRVRVRAWYLRGGGGTTAGGTTSRHQRPPTYRRRRDPATVDPPPYSKHPTPIP